MGRVRGRLRCRAKQVQAPSLCSILIEETGHQGEETIDRSARAGSSTSPKSTCARKYAKSFAQYSLKCQLVPRDGKMGAQKHAPDSSGTFCGICSVRFEKTLPRRIKVRLNTFLRKSICSSHSQELMKKVSSFYRAVFSVLTAFTACEKKPVKRIRPALRKFW